MWSTSRPPGSSKVVPVKAANHLPNATWHLRSVLKVAGVQALGDQDLLAGILAIPVEVGPVLPVLPVIDGVGARARGDGQG